MLNVFSAELLLIAQITRNVQAENVAIAHPLPNAEVTRIVMELTVLTMVVLLLALPVLVAVEAPRNVT